jgi:hypothetical protein
MKARREIQDKAKSIAVDKGWANWFLKWEGSLKAVVSCDGGGGREQVMWQGGRVVVGQDQRAVHQGGRRE